jgi:hypothetical protein
VNALIPLLAVVVDLGGLWAAARATSGAAEGRGAPA